MIIFRSLGPLGWVGQTAVIPSERVQIWVCLFLFSWFYPARGWMCLICVISTYSNGAVQIRVGLELADGPSQNI